MRGSIKPLPSLIAAGVTALVAGTSFALAASDESAPEPGAAARDRAAVAGAAPQLPELVAAFRRARTPEDDIPGGDASEALESLGDAQPGENPDLARRLRPNPDTEAFAWPKSDGVCYQWGSSGACGSTATLAEGVLVSFAYTAVEDAAEAKFDLFVLVRDGIETIRVELRNGQEIQLAVNDNAARMKAQEQPVEVRWENPDGSPGGTEIPERVEFVDARR